MYKFMFCTFAFLAWGFWELSGGSDFEPPAPSAQGDRVLATFGDSASQPATRSRLAASGPAPDTAQTQQAEQVVPASLEVDTPAEAPDDAEIVAALTSGISAIQAETENETGGETYAPTTTSSAISVEPMATGAVSSNSNEDVRRVAGSRVNMRNGPSTDFQVLDQLGRGDEVVVIDSPGGGWVQLRVLATGQIGWMAERLLTPVTN